MTPSRPKEVELLSPRNPIPATNGISQSEDYDLASLADQIRKAALAAECHLRESVSRALHAGELLCAAKERIQHGGWSAWFSECNFEFGERTAQRYMRLFQKWQIYLCEQDLEPNPTELSDLTMTGFLDAHAKSLDQRKLAEPASVCEEQLELSAATIEGTNTQEPRSIVESVEAAEMRDCSGNWQLPQEIAEAVELVLGSVDLALWDGRGDCISASEHCSASEAAFKRHFSWSGSVFLFPAETSDLLPKFSARLLKEHQRGSVTEAIFVVPARTGESWFRGFRQYMRCFLASKSAGDFSGGTNDWVAIYLGERTRRFYEVFEKHGDCYVPFCARHVRHIGSLDLEDEE